MYLDFEKGNGLVPVIVQHDQTLQVLMLGYMNSEALEKTQQTKKVTFYSRSKQRLWTKGESSGNFLHLVSMQKDCDDDTLLVKAIPDGPTCHKGNVSCFGDQKETKGFLYELEGIISKRIDEKQEDSYTYSLYQKGINKVAQKVGEEAVEIVIEAKDNNQDLFLNEGADLLYHLLLLLKAKEATLEDVERILLQRHVKPQ